jgi:filamentous hemagglutinin family protein
LQNHPIQHCPEKAAGEPGARRRGRAGAASCGSWRRLVAWLVLMAFHLTPPGVPVARAAPEGVEFVHGEGTVDVIDTHTEITTFTEQAKALASSFDIAPDESVHAQQPGASSVLLIQVDPGAPTDVSGMLTSNAAIYLLNAAGVYFGNEAVVDVGRLVAGAGEISTEDFLAGRDHFTNLSGPVEVAAGAQLHADSVALVGRTVANHGTILAPDGMIALVAGGDVLLSKLDGRVMVRVEAPPEDPGTWGIQQTGTLDAGAGSVMLAAGDAYSLAMNHSGITRGRDVQLEAGDGGLVAVAGEIDASSREPGGRGGSIRVLGERVAVLDAALDASGDAGGGEILVGGDLQGEGELRTAKRTYVSDEAALRADAIGAGDGGRIIVWADEKTGFFGTLSARGGAGGGDGGFAEISGRYSLESRGDIDLSAPAGRSGTLLYDPEDIEIAGGAPPVPGPPDGDDVDLDPDLLVGDTGTAGDILFTDLGDPSGVAPFTIYESELEGTDADIVLRANRSVIATGTFDHETEEYGEGLNVVRLMDGNDFFIFTATPSDLESTAFAGIDLVSGATNGDTLTWQVSGVGAIFFDTSQFNPSAVGDGATQSAPILVGRLIAEQTLNTLTNQGSENTISIFTGARGSTATGPAIDVGEILANGLDAEENPEEGAPTLAATAGGRVFVQADQGDVVIGRAIARGGSALDLAQLDLAEDGAGGGLVEIRAPDGNLTLETEIDVSGGDGLAGTLDLGEIAGEPIQREVGDAGGGGTIDLCAGNGCDPTLQASTEVRHVFVRGDLTARGGEAVENSATGEIADGGAPGVVKVTSTTGAVYAGTDAGGSSPATFDASGGDGSRSGGGALEDIFSVLVSASGNLELDAHIIADGGAGFDGSGGTRGLVKLSSESGSILAGASSIRAADGAGTETLEPRSDANADVQLLVDPLQGGVVEIGGVAVRGGAGNGDADGSAGGRIEIVAASILAGFSGGAAESGLDASGGAATGAGSDGAGGRIDLEATGDVIAQLTDDGGATLAITQHADDAGTLVGFGDLASWTQIARIDAAADADPQTVRTLDTRQVDLALDYRLDAGSSLAIAVPDAGIGAEGVKIGSAGASIANAGPIEADGVGVHVASRGTVIIDGTSIGSEPNPLRAEALRDVPDVEPKLGLAASGDVYVDLSAEASRVYDVVDLRQADPDAAARIQSFTDADPGTAVDDIDIRSPEGEAIPSSHLVQVDTSTSGFTFAYRLLPTAEDTDSAAARVVIESMNLGGDALVEAVGDVQIGTSERLDGGPPASLAIAANGNDLSLVADAPAQSASASDGVGAIVDADTGDAAIDMGDSGDGSSQLALVAGSGVGSSAVPLRVRRIGRVAGSTNSGDFYLGNDVDGDVRIAQFADVDGVERTGIGATTGDVEIRNDAADGRILFDTLAADGTHVSSGGDQRYAAPVEIENARFDVSESDDGGGTTYTLTASNEARLVAGGDIVFEQRVDTSDDTPGASIATFTRPGGTGGPDVEQFVPGALIVDAEGTTTFAADVGAESPLASIDVTDVYLTAEDTTFDLSSVPIEGTDPDIAIDPAAFQVSGAFGRIDGPSQLLVTAVDPGAALSQITFRGDIGGSERLTGLEVDADRVAFTTAERVVTGSGGIALNVPQDDSATDAAPDTATLYDTEGSIAFETSGDFEIGRLQKFTGFGGLSIRAEGTASFSDLTALALAVDAPTIVWKGRDPSLLLLADGSFITDAGSDLVANDIAVSSVPLWDGEGAEPAFVLGSGGVSAPSSLADYEVIRLTENSDAVTSAILTGPDGAILDLTASRNAAGNALPLVGDPTSEVPRAAPGVAPQLGPRLDAALPTARPQVGAEQVLAFVRCHAGAAAGACDPQPADLAPPETALATPRAMDIAMRYRALVAGPDARARLRAAFGLAVREYRALTGASEVDGARFYGFLRQSPGQRETLEQLNELARLFVEIEMLGMSEADAHAVQRALAEAFAEAAGELDADAVTDAVRASAIGLPV